MLKRCSFFLQPSSNWPISFTLGSKLGSFRRPVCVLYRLMVENCILPLALNHRHWAWGSKCMQIPPAMRVCCKHPYDVFLSCKIGHCHLKHIGIFLRPHLILFRWVHPGSDAMFMAKYAVLWYLMLVIYLFLLALSGQFYNSFKNLKPYIFDYEISFFILPLKWFWKNTI